MNRSRKSTVSMNLGLNKERRHVECGVAFLQQLKHLLSEFGIYAGKIHVRPALKNKFTLILSISNRISILNFHKNSGFLNAIKRLKLEIAVCTIKRYFRVSKEYSSLLKRLKESTGTDKQAVESINKFSEIKYTYRQFEHMRRGEACIPVDMVNASLRALGKKEMDVVTLIENQESR